MNLDSVQNNLKEMCAGVLPFCLIPHELELVKKQFKEDELVLKNQFEKEILEKNLDEIKSVLKSGEFWSGLEISATSQEKITTKLATIFDQKTQSDNQNNVSGVINFSTSQMAQLENQMEIIENEIPKQLEKETQEFSTIIDELRKIETALSNAPKDDEIGPIISELNQQHKKLGTAKAEINHFQQKIGQENSLISHKNMQIRTIVDEKYKAKNSIVQAELSQKIQKVLDEYANKLKAKKLQLFKAYLLDAVQTLMHKQYLIDKVSISNETFGITLYRKNDVPLHKSTLSMGEKQMFATSVLWALARTSGKPLPFMIDTPLARLDSEHKTRLVEKFFPVASHQVVIFSTDTEIDEENYFKLMPYVKNSYSLEYQSDKGKTVLNPGYFFRTKVERK